MHKRINILIIPEGGGQARTYKVSLALLRAGMWVAVGIVVAIAIGAFSYGSVAKKALSYNKLLGEKAQLESENRRIIRVSREVEQSRKILAQIIRSLGGHMELGGGASDSLVAYDDALQSGEISEDATELLGDRGYGVERLMAYGMPTQMPVDGFVSQGFSEDFLFPERSHRGMDIAAKMGSPVVAAAEGRVVFAEWTPYFGNCLLLAHPGGYLTFYGHNKVNLKTVTEQVRRGEPIALLGNSGRSSAPHLHFEIWKDGVAVDPQEFVRGEVK